MAKSSLRQILNEHILKFLMHLTEETQKLGVFIEEGKYRKIYNF